MIFELPAERIDEVRELQLELHEHHAALGDLPGFATRDAQEAWEDWRLAALQALLARRGALLVSALTDAPGQPLDGLAVVSLTPSPTRPVVEPTGPHGELEVLVVAEGARGCGLGELLTDAAAQWLKARGAIAMRIVVRADNPGALRFYRRRGATDASVSLLQDLA